MSTLRPLSDQVIIKPDAAPDKTRGGIALPDSGKEKDRGCVVAVGPGQRLEDGSVAQMQVKVGDRVVYDRRASHTHEFEGEEMRIVREGNILAIFVEDVEGVD
jgi:chaperonin GroES